MPAYGFFIRHVKNVEMTDVEVSYLQEDLRPPFILEDVKGAEFNLVKAQHAAGVPSLQAEGCRGFQPLSLRPAARYSLGESVSEGVLKTMLGETERLTRPVGADR